MVKIMGEPHELKVVNVRLVKEPSLYSSYPIWTPPDAMKVIAEELSQYDREVFAILNLKNNGQVINMNICSVGTINASLVAPREVMKSCILSNASSFLHFTSILPEIPNPVWRIKWLPRSCSDAEN